MHNAAQDSALNAKQLGAILAAFGLACVALGLVLPALGGRAPAYWPQGFLAVLGPAPLAVGTIFVLKGAKARRKFGHPRRPVSWPLWLVMPCAALGASMFFWLRSRYGA